MRILVVLAVLAAVCSAQVCQKPTVGGHDFDFSGLMVAATSPIKITGTYLGATSTFYLNMCSPVSTTAVPANCATSTPGTNFIAYQAESAAPYNCYGLSNASPYIWSVTTGTDPSQGVSVLYTTGTRTGSQNLRNVQVNFVCDAAATTSTPSFTTENYNSASKIITYIFTWKTAAACVNSNNGGGGGGGGNPDGTSVGGTVFLALYFGGIGSYVTIGSAINFYKFRKSGGIGRPALGELLPQSAFWSEFFGTVKDGVRFVFVQRCKA